jgi:uncharacterized protein
VNNFRIALIFYLVTLAGYALALYWLPNLEIWVPSYVYHALMIVFPLVLTAYHREGLRSLGLGWGKWRIGVPSAAAVIVITVLVYWFSYHQFRLPAADHLLLAAVFWGPAAEEMIFRAYLQPKMESRMGLWGGLVITSLLFGMSHLPRIYLRQAAPPLLVPEAFGLGFVFGVIRDRTGSMYYGMFCHMVYNLIVSII